MTYFSCDQTTQMRLIWRFSIIPILVPFDNYAEHVLNDEKCLRSVCKVHISQISGTLINLEILSPIFNR